MTLVSKNLLQVNLTLVFHEILKLSHQETTTLIESLLMHLKDILTKFNKNKFKINIQYSYILL